MSEDISDIIQEEEVIESTTPIVEPSSPALTPFPIIVEPVVPEINTAEVLIEITKITFQQIFENFLNQNKEIINKFNVKITPEMKK